MMKLMVFQEHNILVCMLTLNRINDRLCRVAIMYACIYVYMCVCVLCCNTILYNPNQCTIRFCVVCMMAGSCYIFMWVYLCEVQQALL